MDYVSYMTAGGDWAGNFYGDTPVPDGLIKAPADGRYGVRWTGAEWVADAMSEARVDVFLGGPDLVLQSEREAMICARWQMILALGPDRWGAIMAYASSADAPWGLRVVIENAVEIIRLSETIDVLAWLIGFDDAQVDDLFRVAMSLGA